MDILPGFQVGMNLVRQAQAMKEERLNMMSKVMEMQQQEQTFPLKVQALRAQAEEAQNNISLQKLHLDVLQENKAAEARDAEKLLTLHKNLGQDAVAWLNTVNPGLETTKGNEAFYKTVQGAGLTATGIAEKERTRREIAANFPTPTEIKQQEAAQATIDLRATQLLAEKNKDLSGGKPEPQVFKKIIPGKGVAYLTKGGAIIDPKKFMTGETLAETRMLETRLTELGKAQANTSDPKKLKVMDDQAKEILGKIKKLHADAIDSLPPGTVADASGTVTAEEPAKPKPFKPGDVIRTKAEYEALPSGSVFTDTNGKKWKKP